MASRRTNVPLSDDELFVIAKQFTSDKLMSGFTPEELYVKGTPHPKQELLLNIETDPVFAPEWNGSTGKVPRGKIIEVLFGGSAGGGKTWAMLAAALKYVHIPHYSVLVLRRNFPDLVQEGGLIALAHEWLQGSSAHWSEQQKTWTFPSGATLRFGSLDAEMDKYKYAGGEYQAILFDELTTFSEPQYKFLFSRLRKRREMTGVPLRIMAATNPGGIGGQWVYERFIPEEFEPSKGTEIKVWYKQQENDHVTAFIPSTLDDNPSLDREAYLQSLMQLDELTRQQLLSGSWVIQLRGQILYTYKEVHTVIRWKDFEGVFGTRSIPAHWKVGVYQDFGTTEGHPCVTSWFATAAQNSPVVNGVPTAGLVFLYRGMMLTQASARDTAKQIKQKMGSEIGQCTTWQMSHEASSERIEYNKQGMPFSPWKTGRNRGIEQLKNAFVLHREDKPHPFRPDLMGHPRLILIVDDDELIHAKSDDGLARWRSEIIAYDWQALKSGEPTTRLVPRALFNDAVDTMRAAAADYWPTSTDKSIAEKVTDRVEKIQPTAFVESVEDPEYRAHLYAQRSILAEQARRKLEEVDTVLADWCSIG
jgi:hypothetical protein